VVPVPEPPDDFRSGLLAREVQEELLDVLNLEGPLLESVLFEKVFHRALL
jgi:hypothetical protein